MNGVIYIFDVSGGVIGNNIFILILIFILFGIIIIKSNDGNLLGDENILNSGGSLLGGGGLFLFGSGYFLSGGNLLNGGSIVLKIF